MVPPSSFKPPSYRASVGKCQGQHRLIVYYQDNIQGCEVFFDCRVCLTTIEYDQWLYSKLQQSFVRLVCTHLGTKERGVGPASVSSVLSVSGEGSITLWGEKLGFVCSDVPESSGSTRRVFLTYDGTECKTAEGLDQEKQYRDKGAQESGHPDTGGIHWQAAVKVGEVGEVEADIENLRQRDRLQGRGEAPEDVVMGKVSLEAVECAVRRYFGGSKVEALGIQQTWWSQWRKAIRGVWCRDQWGWVCWDGDSWCPRGKMILCGDTAEGNREREGVWEVWPPLCTSVGGQKKVEQVKVEYLRNN